jgi:hypothetical protein
MAKANRAAKHLLAAISQIMATKAHTSTVRLLNASRNA